MLLVELDPTPKTKKCKECKSIVSQYGNTARAHVIYAFTGALLEQGNRPPDVILCDACNILKSPRYVKTGYKKTLYIKP